jgi:hypothetical protein
MSVTFQIPDPPQLLPLTVHAIACKADGTWEKEWEPLRKAMETSSLESLSRLSRLVPEITYNTYQGLRLGDVSGFRRAGALEPSGCLTRLELRYSLCRHSRTCPSYDARRCTLKSSQQPPCFDFDVELETEILSLVNRIVACWRDDTYVIVHHPK